MTERLPTLDDYAGLKTTVLGLGTFGGGVGAARFLAERGADVTITDSRTDGELSRSIAQLDGLSINRCFWGGHPAEAFRGADLLIVNPAVQPDSDIVEQCRSAGTIITSEIELFLHHFRGKVIAVTGSNGKSTTTSLVHRLLVAQAQAAGFTVVIGGNIGTSLLPCVNDLNSDDIAVLELSSFQLASLQQSDFAPWIAVMTNFSPNHLDWHGNIEHYRAAKQVVFSRQRMTDIAVLSDETSDDESESCELSSVPPDWRVRGRRMSFGLSDTGEDGVFVDSGSLILRDGNREDAIRLYAPSALPGDHNARNIAAAACAAWVAGADPLKFAESLRAFEPLPHRLQRVAEGKGVAYYDDSVATTPESSIAALQTVTQPTVIMAGGADKGVDLSQFADAIRQNTVAAVLMGETAGQLSSLLASPSKSTSLPTIGIASDFADAFARAVALVPEGGIVLLSPGCSSYGWFRDYRERGEQFTKMAKEWISS
ncbi:MAG: UDP-N-acetylmuramoyl-L-alanine--D-glutamate ligase [Fuerstiella sp.]|nr:UDP-N-acetylmuramoyl-L-alanine--D-glutamate ligase [Fuerstiella sp.]MCP4855226.1 UDP-N-acetylmuramoyl-L-alanine--D-glutamate ligase [Fuerstiella sp.]